jgi:hypothetical protein
MAQILTIRLKVSDRFHDMKKPGRKSRLYKEVINAVDSCEAIGEPKVAITEITLKPEGK